MKRTPFSPASRTAFLGRDAELKDLADRFRKGDRLVTVLGPPGAGKTRLAERFAGSWRGGEVVVCLLADATRLSDVTRALAAALDVPLADDTAADDLARLGFAAATRGRCLLVLDNVEQIAEHISAALRGLLDAAPRARFLCTSRQRFALAGESCLPLGGMDPAPARALFLDRARLAGAPPIAGDDSRDPRRPPRAPRSPPARDRAGRGAGRRARSTAAARRAGPSLRSPPRA
ncbi:MAG: ATP-binding protein [Minicystis sp.]